MINNVIKRIDKFEKGIFWNYIAVGLMALNGFVCNFIIALFYDVAAVGLYNRVYSYYLVLAQLSAFGIHVSIAHNIPQLINDKEKQEESLTAAIFSVVLISCIIVVVMKGILACNIPFLDNITKKSINNILLALVLFSINKVVLAFYNGMSMMVEHAVLQATRYICLGMSVFILAFFNVQKENLVLCFAIAEIVVMVLEIIMFARKKMKWNKVNSKYIKEHLGFGKKIFLSNLVLDLNTKVDIISLSIILNDDYYVGIYSFAVMFIEGFYQILVVIRKSLNPKITQYYFGINEEKTIFNCAEKMTKIISIIVYLGIIVGYIIVCLLMGKNEYIQGIIAILIMGISIVMTNKYILYGNVFSQIGEPKKETKVNIITILTNTAANLCLIPIWGIKGAAIATSMSYIVFAIVINKYGKENDKICILFNR